MPKTFYDGKRLFETYHGWGAATSFRRLTTWAEENGMVNPENGKASLIGVRSAMWKWACRNPEESYEIWKRYHFERYPHMAVPSIKEYIKNEVFPVADGNASVCSPTDLRRLLMRFGLDNEIVDRVKKSDVIQIVDPNFEVSGFRGGMYGKLLIVEDVLPEEGFVVARISNGDDTYSVHQIKYGQFGKIGKSIIV